MERMDLEETGVQSALTYASELQPEYEEPCPGSYLKQYDDIEWYGVLTARVLWGTDNPTYFWAYSPDIFGPMPANLGADGVTDRAPVDVNETPMPIYPVQQFAQQPGVREQHGKKQDAKEAIKHLLKQLSPEYAKKVRELVRSKKPELLSDDKDKR